MGKRIRVLHSSMNRAEYRQRTVSSPRTSRTWDRVLIGLWVPCLVAVMIAGASLHALSGQSTSPISASPHSDTVEVHLNGRFQEGAIGVCTLYFWENGLPAGTPWTVYAHSSTIGNFSQSTTGDEIALLLPNGTYWWAASAGPNYVSNLGTVQFTVDGPCEGGSVINIGYAVQFTSVQELFWNAVLQDSIVAGVVGVAAALSVLPLYFGFKRH